MILYNHENKNNFNQNSQFNIEERIPNISLAMSQESYDLINKYFEEIKKIGLLAAVKEKKMGRRLFEVLKQSDINKLTTTQFIDALLKTAKPVIYAENKNHVKSNGEDWTAEEIMLLGRIVRIVKDVTVYTKTTYLPYDDDVLIESQPQATLLFASGALLTGCQADLNRVVTNDKIDKKKYEKFLEENLLPALLLANQSAGSEGAVVTLPVIGGGQFAGKNFQEAIKQIFPQAILNLLKKHNKNLNNIKGVVLTGFKGAKNDTYTFGNGKFIVTENFVGLYPQGVFTEFAKCKIFAVIACDRLAFPGCDGFKLSIDTQEGGSCMVTNLFVKITKAPGDFDYKTKRFLPKQQETDWEDHCALQNTILNFDNCKIYGADGIKILTFQKSESYSPQYLDAKNSANYVSSKPICSYIEVASYGNKNDLKVRNTLGTIIKKTTGTKDLNGHIYVTIKNGCVQISSSAKEDLKKIVEENKLLGNIVRNNYILVWTLSLELLEGLNLLSKYITEIAFSKINIKADLKGQDVLEHLLLICLEEMVGDMVVMVGDKVGWSEPKPYFNVHGELVYTSKNKDPIIGLENLLKQLDINIQEDPLIQKISALENEKKQFFPKYHQLILNTGQHIFETSWKCYGFLGRKYRTCLRKGDDSKDLPAPVKLQYDLIEIYLSNKDYHKNPQELFAKIKQIGTDATKDASMHFTTIQYCHSFTKSDNEFFKENSLDKKLEMNFV